MTLPSEADTIPRAQALAYALDYEDADALLVEMAKHPGAEFDMWMAEVLGPLTEDAESWSIAHLGLRRLYDEQFG